MRLTQFEIEEIQSWLNLLEHCGSELIDAAKAYTCPDLTDYRREAVMGLMKTDNAVIEEGVKGMKAVLLHAQEREERS